MNKRIVFLCSGGGGNLRFLREYSKMADCSYEIAAVIADRPCQALSYANREGIPAFEVTYHKGHTRELESLLLRLEPDLVITNIHKILHKELVNQFSGRLINLHYSLLPAFGGMIGMEPVKAALQQGCRFVGTTVHYVDEEVDHGRILTQSVLTLRQDESFPMLANRVFRAGCLTLLNAVQQLCLAQEKSDLSFYCFEEGQLLSDSFQTINRFSEEFWQGIAEG